MLVTLAGTAPARLSHWLLIATQVCYVENGEGGFTSDLSTPAFSSFFISFLAFLISFFPRFDFFPFPVIASSRAARQTTFTY